MTSPDPRDTPTYLAEKLGFHVLGTHGGALPYWRPHEDLNQTALCEARIAELGLHKAYIDAIYQGWKYSAGAWAYEDNWYYLTLSASQRCEAMRKVLEARSA